MGQLRDEVTPIAIVRLKVIQMQREQYPGRSHRIPVEYWFQIHSNRAWVRSL